MSMFSGKCGLAIMAAVLCLSWSAAHAQGEPVKYWVPFGPFGFGSGAAEAANAETYGSFPSFDAGNTGKSGFSFRSYSAPVSSLTGGLGWSSAAAFGNLSSLSYEGNQFGYNFKGVGNLPMTVFGSFDTLKTNPDVFSAIVAPGFTGGTTAATSLRGGVEIRPTSNLSLSFSAGFTQQQTDPGGGDIQSSFLPRELGGRR